MHALPLGDTAETGRCGRRLVLTIWQLHLCDIGLLHAGLKRVRRCSEKWSQDSFGHSLSFQATVEMSAHCLNLVYSILTLSIGIRWLVFRSWGISHLPCTIASSFLRFSLRMVRDTTCLFIELNSRSWRGFLLGFLSSTRLFFVCGFPLASSSSPWPLSQAHSLLKHASATTASSLSTFLAIRLLLLHSESSRSWSASGSTFSVRSHRHKAIYAWSCWLLSLSAFNLICGENL